MLTDTRWLMMGVDGAVTLGLSALSGWRPRPLSIQTVNAAGTHATMNPVLGFSLTSVIDDGTFLVTPRRAFAVGAMVDINDAGGSSIFRLTSALAEGYDFKVFSYSPDV